MNKRSVQCFFLLLSMCLFACHSTTQEHSSSTHARRAGVGVLALRHEAFSDSATFVFFKDKNLQDTLLVCDLNSLSQASPYINRPQEKTVYWKCLGWNRHHYVVALNDDEWQKKAYIALDTARFRFVPWKDLLNVAGEVERLSFEKNPVRVSPKNSALPVAWDAPRQSTFGVKEVYKQWLRVGDAPKEGWIRWVHHDTLYIQLADSLWRAPELLTLPPDPTTDPLIHRLNAAEKKIQKQ
ncbi:MAG: hypothetical protein KatS3mg033_0503 [Thermonema sp.]|uniref:hypothetical protein n=1 Tax=Thermonema sp. TaxID=2231181 RepID=UPI0021DBAB8A|nr:hypothetical protein [Thermonema sp.]GIV38703.1 MAG: hypothetical protein KatS3mg033_0503 [Thermonema sp.]